MNPTIQTFRGHIVDLANPDPATLDLLDIGHALSFLNRFTGHTTSFYSNAQHSLLVADLCRQEDPSLEIHGLMHDAHEAYLGDMSAPLKLLVPEYKKLETSWHRVIYLRFLPGLVDRLAQVKKHDPRALAIERYAYMRGAANPTEWERLGEFDPAWPEHSRYIRGMLKAEADSLFTNRFTRLGGTL